MKALEDRSKFKTIYYQDVTCRRCGQFIKNAVPADMRKHLHDDHFIEPECGPFIHDYYFIMGKMRRKLVPKSKLDFEIDDMIKGFKVE